MLQTEGPCGVQKESTLTTPPPVYLCAAIKTGTLPRKRDIPGHDRKQSQLAMHMMYPERQLSNNVHKRPRRTVVVCAPTNKLINKHSCGVPS